MAYFRRKRNAPVLNEKNIDYKNLDLLKEYVTESGRMVPSRVSGANAKRQRFLSHQIKLARYIALLPYCDMHE